MSKTNKPTPNKPTELEVKEAIKVILADKQAYNTSLNYAIAYGRAALTMTGYELKVQCLYILGNITHWCNSTAPSVRATLKNFSKGA